MWNADKSVRSLQLARTFYLTRLEPSSQKYFFDELVSSLVAGDSIGSLFLAETLRFCLVLRFNAIDTDYPTQFNC